MFNLRLFFSSVLLIIILALADTSESKADLRDFNSLFKNEPAVTAAKNVLIKKKDLGYIKSSWYGPKFHGKLTANGELYDQMGLTAAHKTLPFGTMLLLENEETGKKTVVRINDRGPYIESRELDLSKGAAIALGTIKKGVVKLKVQILSPQKEISPVL